MSRDSAASARHTPETDSRSSAPFEGNLTPLDAEDSPSVLLAQHMLRDTAAWQRVLNSVDLHKRHVLEFGVGTGILSNLILSENPSSVRGYEIDPTLVPEDLRQKMEVRFEDFTEADFDYLSSAPHTLISCPPYSKLEWIRDEIIEKHKIADVILLVSESKLDLFPGYEIVGELSGDSFSPPSRGTHYIIKRGFESEDAKSVLRSKLARWSEREESADWPTQQVMDELVQHVKDKIIDASRTEKFGANRRLVIYLTDNPKKLPEAKRNLNLYGIETIQAPHIEHPDVIKALLALKIPNVTILNVLRETSDLYRYGTDKISEQGHLERVENRAELRSYRMHKGLLACEIYRHETEGYLDLNRAETDRANVFGWDDIFVPVGLQNTFHELREMGRKISSRDMVISKFVMDRFHYRQRVNLAQSPHFQSRVVDFEALPADFIAKSPFLNHPATALLHFNRVLIHALNEGVYFRAAANRREKNYWLPGLNAGIPLTPKRDAVHEATFMAHDFGHFLIPDKIIAGSPDDYAAKLYIAHRMMSEAVTIVLADMVFIDALRRGGIEYDFGRRKIYPLFRALGIDFTKEGEFFTGLEAVLRANVQYCLEGDDSGYRRLLARNGSDDSTLEDFKGKYMAFFVEDFRWTERNLVNMKKRADEFAKWWELVAPLNDALGLGLETLSDYRERLEPRESSIVDAVFDDLYKNRLVPILSSDAPLESSDVQRARAFGRYMIGQMALLARFDFVPESERVVNDISQELMRFRDGLTAKDTERIRSYFEQYVDQLARRNLITLDDAVTFKEIYPLFDPYYVFYDEEESFYEDLRTISSRLLGRVGDA